MVFVNDSNYLDQHFLIDEKIINDFINLGNFSKEDTVLEIGPGKGVLTKKIASLVKKLYVIEKDERLIPCLEEIPNIEIILGDAVKCEYPSVDMIITSLPYSIIEPFIKKIVKLDFKELYLLMGSNYINNCIENKITYLTLLTNIYFDVKKIEDVPKECFKPAPRVMSSLAVLTPKIEYSNIDMFFRCLYSLDDKLIKNGMMEAFIKVKNITKREAKEIINNLDIDNKILGKKFLMITNEELNIIYKKVNGVV